MDLVFDIKEGLKYEVFDHKTVVIISESDNLPNYRQVLSALLKAIKKEESITQIIAMPPDLDVLVPEKASEVLIFIERSTALFPNADIKPNEFTKFNAVEVLCTYSLKELAEDVNKKRVLWNTLRKKYL